MRYTVTKQVIYIIGRLWAGSTAATRLELNAYELEAIGEPSDREAVALWVANNAGDFSSVTDFRADFHVGDENIVHEWSEEENEIAFADCMFPSED